MLLATRSEPNQELLLTKTAKRRLGSRIPVFGRQGQQEKVAMRGRRSIRYPWQGEGGRRCRYSKRDHL